MRISTMMKETVNYRVAGHRFGVTADEEHFRLMHNYEPFSDTVSDADPSVFALSIVRDTSPVYTEVIRQVEGEQTIICGTASDGSPVFEFRCFGSVVGWLVCSDDYHEGCLILTENLPKLAIDNTLMIMYALSTAGKNTLLFHAAAVELHGRGYMFLGPSGTGKSTHARLWIHNIAGTQLLNDDNPVVRFQTNGVAMVYGSPWSGKTPCYRNIGLPLDAIVLLSQASCNRISPLRGVHAYAAMLPAVSGTRWDRRIADGLHATESLLVGSVTIWHMGCLPDREAAEMCESTINSH